MRLFSGSGPPGDEEALERAIGYARRSGNRRAALEATVWLLFTLNTLRVPADVALDRAEQALAAAGNDPWEQAAIRQAFAPLYAFVGRFAEARAALARSRALWAAS